MSNDALQSTALSRPRDKKLLIPFNILRKSPIQFQSSAKFTMPYFYYDCMGCKKVIEDGEYFIVSNLNHMFVHMRCENLISSDPRYDFKTKQVHQMNGQSSVESQLTALNSRTDSLETELYTMNNQIAELADMIRSLIEDSRNRK